MLRKLLYLENVKSILSKKLEMQNVMKYIIQAAKFTHVHFNV